MTNKSFITLTKWQVGAIVILAFFVLSNQVLRCEFQVLSRAKMPRDILDR